MGWEVGSWFKSEGTYAYLWLIHADVWQKATKFCKAIILQFKNKLRMCLKAKKKKKRIQYYLKNTLSSSPVAQMVKNLPAIQELPSIPRSGRSPGKGNGNTLHYSYLENPMDRGAWWATVHGVTKSGPSGHQWT